MNETEERIALRMLGGVHEGTYTIPVSVYGWPLPDVFEAPGGIYVKVTESSVEPDTGIIRGAQFEWRELPEDRSGEGERGAESG